MITSSYLDLPSGTVDSLGFAGASDVPAMGGCATCCGDDSIVCRCFQVTKQEVYDAVASGNARTISQLRCQTQAGSGCMACLCKIKQLLAERAEALAVEAGELELAAV